MKRTQITKISHLFLLLDPPLAKVNFTSLKEQAFILEVVSSQLEYLGLIPSSCLQQTVVGVCGRDSGKWIPATHMKDLNYVLAQVRTQRRSLSRCLSGNTKIYISKRMIILLSCCQNETI